MNNKEVLFEMLRKLAVLKAAEVSTERLKLFCEILSQFKIEDVRRACNKVALESRFFPDISDFINILKPKLSVDDMANEVSAEIINSIRRFGTYRGADAQNHLGEVAWDIVLSFGGWGALCSQNTSSINTLRAQIRDLARSKIKSNPDKKILPGKEHEKLSYEKNTFESAIH